MKLFAFKTSGIVFFGVLFLSSLIWAANNHAQPPLTIYSSSLVKPEIKSGEPLTVTFDLELTRECQSFYAVKSVANNNGTIIWSGVKELKRRIKPEPREKIDIQVEVPIQLAPGDYTFRSEMHMVCDSGAYTIPTILLKFKVVS